MEVGNEAKLPGYYSRP